MAPEMILCVLFARFHDLVHHVNMTTANAEHPERVNPLDNPEGDSRGGVVVPSSASTRRKLARELEPSEASNATQAAFASMKVS